MYLRHFVPNQSVVLVVVLCLGTVIAGKDKPTEDGDDIKEEVVIPGPGIPSAGPPASSGLHLKASSGRLQDGLAKKLLQKWGYMETQLSDGRWDYVDWRKELDNPAISVDSTLQSFKSFKSDENEDSWSNTVKDKYHQGISSFQKKFSLPVTGELDSRTVELMQQPRCAVPDNTGSSRYMDEDDTSFEEQQKVKDSGLKSGHKNRKKMLSTSKQSKLDAITGKKDASGKKSPPKPRFEDVLTTRTVARSTSAKTTPKPTSNGNVIRRTPTLAAILRGSEVLPNRTESDFEVVTDMSEVITETVNTYTTAIGTERVYDTDAMVTDVQDQRTKNQHLEERRRRSAPGLLQKVLQRSRRTSSYICNHGFNAERTITWRIIKKSGSDKLTDSVYLTSDSTRSIVEEAFRRWAEVSQLTFKEDNSQTNVDIWIQFVSDGASSVPYGCGQYVWCFYGSEMAASFHSYVYSNGQYTRRAYIYFRDDPIYPWGSNNYYYGLMDLFTAAVHEIGHILCLDHDDVNSYYDSVMSPYVMYFFPDNNFQVPIDVTARRKLKDMYGACTDPFVAFDWIRTENGVKLYSTYMFRGNHYWQWENSNQQTRYGDPRITSSSSTEWPGVPSNLQAVVQITPKGSSLNELYFFAGGRSYLYDQTNKRVSRQGSISSMWPSKPGSSTSIPTNIKAAYFDKRDGNVYFFTSTMVYEYDYSSNTKGCCNSIKSISTAFPGRYNGYPALENNIDLAYYSIADRKLYFLKGEDYWESTYNPSSTSVYNRVNLKQYGWHEKWKYICEV
ncbi:matrix metallopeptidase-21-like [Amphiura filiformis]|uniref:matrix metallopeptidase-21-like n=1 Tax=Amphiura filiformis TaxID=82378 RepID=UPI003B20B8B4